MPDQKQPAKKPDANKGKQDAKSQQNKSGPKAETNKKR